MYNDVLIQPVTICNENGEIWIRTKGSRDVDVRRRMTNDPGLVKKRRNLVRNIMTRKIKLLGDIIRHNNSVTNNFGGKVVGRREKIRPRQSSFKGLCRIMSCKSYGRLKRKVTKRGAVITSEIAIRNRWYAKRNLKKKTTLQSTIACV